jgi:hypothetical protein
MKLLLTLAAFGLFLLALPARADYVDEADDLAPPLTEAEAQEENDTESLWNSVGAETSPDADMNLDLRQGDVLTEVQEIED